MFDKALKPYRKRLNTDIIAKADIAFDAIKRYELEQSRIYFHKNRNSNQKNLLTELDKDYSKLTPHKKIELDQVYHISLFTYSQQFYCLEMINYVFPMRVFFKNVKNDGILYIGYDQQYPGIEHHNKLSIFQSEVGENQRNYDLKEAICKDMLIILKDKGNKMVKYVYFTISAGSSLLMFDFKVEFFGLIKNDRVLSQDKLRNLTKINLGKGCQLAQRVAYNNSQQSRQRKQSQLPEISKRNKDNTKKVNEFQVFTQQIHKKFSKGSITPQKQFTSRKDNPNTSQLLNANKKSSSHHIFKQTRMLGGINVKGDVDLKLQEKKRNKQLYEIYKQKDKQLSELSGKCKRLIQDYRKTYNQQSVRKRKLNKYLATIVNSMLYVKRITKKYEKAVRKQKMAFKVVYLCRRFIKNLKKKYEQTCKMQPFRYKRLMAEQITGLQVQSKLIFKNSIIRASKQVREIFSFLQPIISLNKSFLLSDVYRNKMILIQKAWKSKYHNRIKALLQFIDRHVQKMTKQYQNLKIFIDDFQGKEVNKQICLNYIKDQSQKYRFIYDAYQRKLQQIDEIKQVNDKISIQSPRNTSRIIVPKRPIRPIHRFFRNCDILKSMVRSWFQIQFKKHSRKCISKSFK